MRECVCVYTVRCSKLNFQKATNVLINSVNRNLCMYAVHVWVYMNRRQNFFQNVYVFHFINSPGSPSSLIENKNCLHKKMYRKVNKRKTQTTTECDSIGNMWVPFVFLFNDDHKTRDYVNFRSWLIDSFDHIVIR